MSDLYNKIICAIAEGESELAKKFIDEMEDVSYIDDDTGRAVLHWAAQEGDTKILRHMIRKGVNVDLPDRCGNTALYIAIGENDYDASRFLLESKANANHTSRYDGSSALIHAVNWADDSLVELLLSYGADPHLSNDQGETASDVAEAAKRPRLMEIFKE